LRGAFTPRFFSARLLLAATCLQIVRISVQVLRIRCALTATGDEVLGIRYRPSVMRSARSTYGASTVVGVYVMARRYRWP